MADVQVIQMREPTSRQRRRQDFVFCNNTRQVGPSSAVANANLKVVSEELGHSTTAWPILTPTSLMRLATQQRACVPCSRVLRGSKTQLPVVSERNSRIGSAV